MNAAKAATPIHFIIEASQITIRPLQVYHDSSRDNSQNRRRLSPYLLQLAKTGDRHGIVTIKAMRNGALHCIKRDRSVMGGRGVGFARARRGSGHRLSLHPACHGHSGVWRLSAGGRRRVDRRHATALKN
jgi:hypothetical protein